MCEIFGISSAKKIRANTLLTEFFSHAQEHSHGWGLATFSEHCASIEKEPISAVESSYLKHRLSDAIEESVLLAHIRKASVGDIQYKNTHPFSARDRSGRLWTLIHNGTIFESTKLDGYLEKQKGSTDSERILLYVMDQMNRRQEKEGRDLGEEERFKVLEEVIHCITPKNKVNLLIYDGDLFYLHMNHKDSLYFCEKEDSLVVSTKPLDQDGWKAVPLNTLFAYRNGALIYTGGVHENEYIKVGEESTCEMSLICACL